MAEKPVLSICIPTFQRKRAIGITLEALTQELKKYPNDVEICVSDNGSNDGTYELLKKYAKKYQFVRIRRNHENLGFDANLIAVLKMAKGKYCWTIGDDDIIVPDRIISLVETLKGRDFIGGVVVPRFCQRPNRAAEFFQKDDYNNEEFITAYKKYVEKMGAVGNEFSGFMGCYLFRTNIAQDICDKIKVSCYGWCHFVLFLHLISAFKGRLLVYKNPIIDDSVVCMTNESWATDKIFLPGEGMEMFIDKKLMALEVLPISQELKECITKMAEKECPYVYKKDLIKLIVIKDITPKSTYAKIKERMNRIERTISCSMSDWIIIHCLKIIENNSILRKIAMIFLVQVQRVKDIIEDMKKYNQGLLIANERRDDDV